MDDIKNNNSLVNEDKNIKCTSDKKNVNKNNKVCNEKKIKKLKLKISKIKKEYKNNVLRYKAEIENIIKRNENEIKKVYKYSLERFMYDLLPVIDNLEKSLNNLNININDDDKLLLPTRKGIELTLKSFLDVIRKFGLNVIDDINVDFNPEIHQAITVKEVDNFESNKVISILQKGYILNEKLIRPAMVIVSK